MLDLEECEEGKAIHLGGTQMSTTKITGGLYSHLGRKGTSLNNWELTIKFRIFCIFLLV